MTEWCNPSDDLTWNHPGPILIDLSNAWGWPLLEFFLQGIIFLGIHLVIAEDCFGFWRALLQRFHCVRSCFVSLSGIKRFLPEARYFKGGS